MRKRILFHALALSALLILYFPPAMAAQGEPTHASAAAQEVHATAGNEAPPLPPAAAATPKANTAVRQSAPPHQDAAAASLAAALEAYKNNDIVKAMDYVWIAEEEIWRKAPLSVRNVAFVTEQPENFGTYIPKEGEVFKSPELMILYCEPTGFTQLKESQTYRYSLIGGFDILNEKGEIIGSQRNLGPFEQRGYRTFATETMLVLTIGIQGLPAGKYSIRVMLTDNLDQSKAVQIEKPFQIVD